MFEVLTELRGVLYRTLTTNGLPLHDPEVFARLVRAHPDKVHVSIHAPENPREVARVAAQAEELEDAGLRSGVNLLVRRSRLPEATRAAALLRDAGISNARVVYLSMRGEETPTPAEMARVAAGPFQSMTCLNGCGKSPRFASVDASREAAWCSYTQSRRRLEAPTYDALVHALTDRELAACDGAGLVRLMPRPRRTSA